MQIFAGHFFRKAIDIGHHIHMGVQRLEKETAGSFVFLGLQLKGGLQSPLLFKVKLQLLPVVEHHLVHLCPFESGEHIVLVRVHELVRWSHHVVCAGERECTFGKLAGQIVLLVERVSDLTLIIVFMAVHAMCVIA